MKSTCAIFAITVIFTGCGHNISQKTGTGAIDLQNEHANHVERQAVGDMSTVVKDLSASPRHQEWIIVENDGKKIQTFVVYPQKSVKSKVVVIIHENRGLTDWVRNMADQVAAEGYIAVAPDLLSEFSDAYRQTSDFPAEDAVIKALGTLNPVSVTSDIEAVVKYSKTIPAANGQVVSMGFCWGGSQTFRLATQSSDISAALVFYGSAPTEQTDFNDISVPVYGFYGGNDERINSTLSKTAEFMSAAGKKFEQITYSGAGHAFMRSGEAVNPQPANQAARAEAWERMKMILRDK